MKTKSAPSSSVPSAVPSSFGTPDKKAVARIAYELWQRRGCPSGRDEMIWLEAERLVARGGDENSTPARKFRAVEEATEGLRDLDLVGLPGDSRERGPTSL